MTVTCRNCGAQLTDDYARVLAPEALAAEGEVRCCPDCETKIRRNGRVVKARAARRGTPEATRYDPEKASDDQSPETETDDALRTDGGRCTDEDIQTPPRGDSLGRHATLYHVGMGALDRVSGPQTTDGARFYAPDKPVDDYSRIIVEFPDDDALAAAWEEVLFADPSHAQRVLEGEDD